MNTPKTAVFAGDVSLDSSVLVPHAPGPDEKVIAAELVEDCGGVVANAAVACHLAGAPARFAGAIGDDPAGRSCVSRLGERGVAVRPTRMAGPTARAFVTLAGDGEKRLVLAKGVSMYPPPEACEAIDLDDAGWLHTALYDVGAAAGLIDRCRRSGVPWSIDLEPATFGSGLPAVAACLRGAEVVFVNARATALLGEGAETALFAAGVRAVVETGGPSGARWRTPADQVTARVPAGIGPIVDSTGAGDCLAGSFVARRLCGETPATALNYAVLAASLSCTRLGAQRSYPDRGAIRRAAAPEPRLTP